MASISGCAKADEADLVGHLSPVIGVGDEEDIVAKLIEWPCLKGFHVEYPTSSSRFREFCKAKSSIDGIWGHTFAYRGNFFRTCSVSQGGDYLYLLPNLAKEKKCRRLGDKVSLDLAKSVMNLIGVCSTQLNCNFWEVIFVCETLNGRWAASGSEKRITAMDFLEYYAVMYVTATNGINCKVSRKESFIGIVAREDTELDVVLKELEISRFKRVASKDDKVRRSQAKRRLVGKTLGSMDEKLTTSKLNIPLKLARLNEILDGPVDMAMVSSTVIRNLAKRKAVKRGAVPRSVSSLDDSSKMRKVISPTKSQEMLEESDKIAEGADLRPRFEVEADLVEEQCRAKAREKMVAAMDEEFKKLEEKLTRERVDFQLEREKEKEAIALKLKQVRAESEAEAERLVIASAISRNNLAGKLYQLRYMKAEITTFSKGNYEEMEIMDEEEAEEREGGLNTAEKANANNQETINQEIENSYLRVVDLDGLLKVEKKSSAELEKEQDTTREREEQTLLYNAEYAEEYEALISQYENRLDDNLTSELAELKEKAMSGSRHEAELAEYRIRALNEEISDMKCNIHALNELVLKREIDLDTARTNLVVSKADFEKLSSSIVGKEAQNRADLVEIQAKNQYLVDDFADARGNVKRATQREKEMNERINQLCARISESERELRVREMKYQKDLKFELDKRDCEIASGEGSREMKEFLR
ncbi:hypothetical protein GIB67_040353 [Kingdonia uniflora]|uniref:Uncharacterized protein n=1 Tax=Kingdonia uniflora TaxID=39325 RepID=A0A7J7L990_9MAGN|nr:hypothetical protein GIB67_040353 [Kingdonia uniflora]